MSEREAFEAWANGYDDQRSWDIWQAACKWQRGKDAEICLDEAIEARRMAREGGSAVDDGRDYGASYCHVAILNQGDKE